MKTAQKVLLVLLLVTGWLLMPKSAFASNFHLVPAGNSIGIGQTEAIQVRLNSGGQAVNGVTAVLSYPADKLDVSYITPGSAFSIEAEKSVADGTIRISRGSISPVSGDAVVATIGFRGKTLGKATVGFLPGSAAPDANSSSDTLNFGASTGGTFDVVQAITQPSNTSGPAISGIQISNISSNSATISWKTDRKTDSELFYGVDKNQLALSTIKNDSATEHSLNLQNLQSPPGTLIYFQIKAKDASGLSSSSETQNVQLLGYKIVIKLVDKLGKPLSNVKITLYSEPNQNATNDQGVATYTNVMPGKHTVLIENGTLQKSEEITVADNNQLDQAQTFNLTFNPSTGTTPRSKFNTSKNLLAVVILGGSFIVLAAIAVYIFKKRQGKGRSTSGDGESFPFFEGGSNKGSSSNPVVFHPGQP